MSVDQQAPAGPQAARPPATGLDITALVLAFILPIVGLILALTARSTARREGGQTSQTARTALFVSTGLTILTVIASIFAAIILAMTFAPLLSTRPAADPPGAPPAVPSQSVSEVVLHPTWSDGADLNRGELETATGVIASRLDRAGVDHSGIVIAGNGRIHVTFDDRATTTVLDLAAQALDGALRADFRPVLASGSCDSPTSPVDQDPARQVVLCDEDGVEGFTLGPSEAGGERLTAVSAVELQGGGASTGEWAVLLTFDGQGASAIADLTRRLIAEPVLNRVAIVLDGVVLSAPAVQAVIMDGQLQIAGGFDREAAETLAERMESAARGLVLQVESTNALR